MLQQKNLSNFFLKNKYLNWYIGLINKRLINPIFDLEYSEKHHIIPISLSNDNSKFNIVRLTPREHYIAHVLLTKITTGINKRKMAFALSFFNTKCKNHNRYVPKSKLYEMSRRLLKETMKGIKPSKKCLTAVSMAKKGKPLSNEQKIKLSKSLKKNKPVLIISNVNDVFIYKDYREHNGISLHTLDDKIKESKKNDNFSIIMFGKHKGWMIHWNTNLNLNLDKIDMFRNEKLNQFKLNKSLTTSKSFTNERKNINSKKNSKSFMLKDPNGNIHYFKSLTDMKQKFPDRPISTIQSRYNNKQISSGPWKGWFKI